MAAPTLVDQAVAIQAQGGDNDLDFTLSGGTPANGDVLIAVFTSTTAIRQINVPTGWTEKYNSNTTDANVSPLVQIMYRVASSESSGTYTFTFGAYGNSTGVLMRWSGAADPATDSGTVARNLNQADDANITSPATTPTNADSIVLRIVVSGTAGGTPTCNGPPTSHTRVTGTPLTPPTSGFAIICVDYRTQGASSSGTETYDAGPDYHVNFDAFTWFFGPSGGGGGTTPKGPLGNPFFGPFGGPV